MKTYTHLYKNRYSRESVCGCVGMAVHKRDPRVGWSWIKVEKGWRGGSVLGSKTEGENVPREIIDCIRRVSIPGADCAAQLLPRKALSASSRRVQVWVRLCTFPNHAANGKCLLEITNLATSPTNDCLNGRICNNRGFYNAFNEQPWCNAIRRWRCWMWTGKNHCSNLFVSQTTRPTNKTAHRLTETSFSS